MRPHGSNESAAAPTSRALHQSCQITCASGCSPLHSTTRTRAGVFPPWPLTTRTRRKPCAYNASSRSASTRTYVSMRSVSEPGYAANDGVSPYASTGSTGTPIGSAASTATRSARMLSVSSDRYACCSVEPTGRTIRSSRSRYASSCIQFRSRTRTRAREGYGVVVVTVVAVCVVSVVVCDVVTVSVCVDAGPPETFIRTFDCARHLLIRRRILGDDGSLGLLRRHLDHDRRRAPRPRPR